jgi:hypothetical protein
VLWAARGNFLLLYGWICFTIESAGDHEYFSADLRDSEEGSKVFDP